MSLAVFLVLLGNSFSTALTECPPCPKNEGQCHEQIIVSYKNCQCEICLTLCFERLNHCGVGFACQMEPIFYDQEEVGNSAVCKKFESCPRITCENDCPASGFFKDVNGCMTCVCEDPCKELNCPEKDCMAEWSLPESEPTYECLKTKSHHVNKEIFCPKCPENAKTCDRLVDMEFGSLCSCSVCAANCYVRESPCKKGEVCIMKPIMYGNTKVSETAECVKFSQCANLTCPVSCQESGYFVDKNNCTTCLCNDPCKELKCSRGSCLIWSSDLASEPKYECQEN